MTLYSDGEILNCQYWIYFKEITGVAIRHFFFPRGCQESNEVSLDWNVNWMSQLYKPPQGWYGPFEFLSDHVGYIPKGVSVVMCPECDLMMGNASQDASGFF